MEKLSCGDVAVDDTSRGVGEHHDQRCRLDHRVEQQFALVEVEALAPQQVPERVVSCDELTQFAVRNRSDADAEIVIAQAENTVAYGAHDL